MKPYTVALVLAGATETDDAASKLLEVLHDPYEIDYMETALKTADSQALQQIYSQREKRREKENEFGNHLEELLSQPHVNPELRRQGLQWFRSKIKTDSDEKKEKDAVQVISEHALQMYQSDPTKLDYFLMGPNSQVRIRIFTVPPLRRI